MCSEYHAVQVSDNDCDRCPNSTKENASPLRQPRLTLFFLLIRYGFGCEVLPYALSPKYPHAKREWIWQYVFRSMIISRSKVDGFIRRHHLSAKGVFAWQHLVVVSKNQDNDLSNHIDTHCSMHFSNGLAAARRSTIEPNGATASAKTANPANSSNWPIERTAPRSSSETSSRSDPKTTSSYPSTPRRSSIAISVSAKL